MKYPLMFAALLCGCLFSTAAFAKAEYQPGFDFCSGKVRVTPTVNFSLFWESNIGNSAAHEESGFGWRIQPAVGFSYNAKRTTFGSNAFYTLERMFDSDKGGDSDSYGITFSLLHKITERLRLTSNASYTRSENDNFYWTNSPDQPGQVDKDETENYNFNVALGLNAKRWHGSVGAGWRRTEYLDKNGQTSDAMTVSVMAGRAIGAHTYWDFSLATTIDRPSDGDDSVAYILMTGVSGEVSERTSYSALAGASIYQYNGIEDETAIGPSYNISGSYRLTRKATLSLMASSRYESEYAGGGASKHSYLFAHTLTAAMNYQWTDIFSTRLDVRYNLEQQETVAGYAARGDRTYWQANFSAYYQFNPFASLFGNISYSMDEYDAGSERDNTRCSLGLSVRF